jgi:hypothetical protein
MQDYRYQEHDAHDPKKHAKVSQMLRVAIHPIRAEKNLQITEQMPNDEQDQDDSGDRDDELFAD